MAQLEQRRTHNFDALLSLDKASSCGEGDKMWMRGAGGVFIRTTADAVKRMIGTGATQHGWHTCT